MLWLKALHIVAVISWMAGLLYLPRLFVYHTKAAAGSELAKTFQVMEQRLLRVIMNPAMLVTWGSGLVLAWWMGVLWDWWFLVKAALVVAMTIFHMKLAGWRKAFAVGPAPQSERFFRIANEVPTVLMIGIVLLVVLKPSL
jgi:protoporphyrinogen IX oxidase